jgi:hypothetical protein
MYSSNMPFFPNTLRLSALMLPLRSLRKPSFYLHLHPLPIADQMHPTDLIHVQQLCHSVTMGRFPEAFRNSLGSVIPPRSAVQGTASHPLHLSSNRWRSVADKEFRASCFQRE